MSLLATLAALLSALALYAGSRHCRARWLQPLHNAGTAVGLVLAALALALWIAALGAGAGLCAMLATWMAGLMAAPWLCAPGAGDDAARTRR